MVIMPNTIVCFVVCVPECITTQDQQYLLSAPAKYKGPTVTWKNSAWIPHTQPVHLSWIILGWLGFMASFLFNWRVYLPIFFPLRFQDVLENHLNKRSGKWIGSQFSVLQDNWGITLARDSNQRGFFRGGEWLREIYFVKTEITGGTSPIGFHCICLGSSYQESFMIRRV